MVEELNVALFCGQCHAQKLGWGNRLKRNQNGIQIETSWTPPFMVRNFHSLLPKEPDACLGEEDVFPLCLMCYLTFWARGAPLLSCLKRCVCVCRGEIRVLQYNYLRSHKLNYSGGVPHENIPSVAPQKILFSGSRWIRGSHPALTHILYLLLRFLKFGPNITTGWHSIWE